MIGDLKERILNLRAEISKLVIEKKKIQNEINTKSETLEELEKLTVNQLDIFEGNED